MRLLRRSFTVAVLTASALAGPDRRDDLPHNDASLCPYCHGDEALMRAAGIVSHGGFLFGREDNAAIDTWMATVEIKWIETPHFEIGIALSPYKVPQSERNKLRAEAARLRETLPDIPKKPKTLDPWLRAHLYAMRAEDLWDRFVELADVDPGKFPGGDTVWDMQGKYMGEGPYLGMKGKYEVLLFESEAASRQYLEKHFGVINHETQRWHLPERGTLSITAHTQSGRLRRDDALHGHLAFNLAHNFLDGYKHYAYETPVWLHEGLAHFLEREIDPENNSFDSAEGAVAAKTSKSNWDLEVRKLLSMGDAPHFSQLVNLKTYAELEVDHHYVTWSIVKYLIESDPAAFAKLLDGINGLKDEQGMSDGSQLRDRQRALFRELYGTTYAQFHTRWADWALVEGR